MEGLSHTRNDVLGTGDEEGMLDEGHRGTDDVGLLKGIRPDSTTSTWPVMASIGTESMCASAMAVMRLVAPGPDVATQTPGRPVTMA